MKDCKLAWVWAMNDGRRQPADAARAQRHHVSRATPRNIVQALDAKTGDLIWENQVGPEQIVGFGSMRNIAIYDDKIIMATTDARLVALDARTGKKMWETRDRRSREGLLEHERSDRREGQGHPGPAGLRSLSRGRSLLHQRLRRGHRQAAVEVQHHRAHRRAGRRHLGQAARRDARGRRNLDRRQLRSGSRISPTGASRRPSRGCRRAAATRSSTRRSTRRRPWR